MRIGIDGRFYGVEGKGIGRYTQKLISHLEKIDQVNDYFIFLRKENIDLYQSQNSHFHKVLAPYQWYSLSEQIFFPFKLYQYHLDIVHFLHFNVPLLYFKKFIVTIHDLIIHQSSLNASKHNFLVFYFKKFAYKIIIRNAILKSQKIIAVSNFTKQEILKNYKIPRKKIVVIYEAP